MNQINPSILPVKTQMLVNKLSQEKPDFLNHFYLSGGTALALQIHHRQSEDLDFFSQNSFETHHLLSQIKQLGNLTEVSLAKDTLNLYLDKVKFQFLVYPYRLIEPLQTWQKLKLSSTLDVA